MEHQKILSLLNEASGPKLAIRKMNIVNLSMINEMQIMMQDMKLSIIQKY